MRHAPNALARDAPVGALGDHVGNSLFTPGRHPAGLLDFVQRALAQFLVIHVDEPLLGGAEDDGIVAAPAVGIGVVERARRPHQHAARLQQFDDGSVGVKNPLAHIFGQALEDFPRLVHRAVDIDAVLHAGQVVLAPMAGSGMHDSRAILGGHIIRHHRNDSAVEKGWRTSTGTCNCPCSHLDRRRSFGIFRDPGR